MDLSRRAARSSFNDITSKTESRQENLIYMSIVMIAAWLQWFILEKFQDIWQFSSHGLSTLAVSVVIRAIGGGFAEWNLHLFCVFCSFLQCANVPFFCLSWFPVQRGKRWWCLLFFFISCFFPPLLNVLVQALLQCGSLLADCVHSAEEVPIEVLRQREAKWLEMLNSWDKWMAKKHKKVCLSIPTDARWSLNDCTWKSDSALAMLSKPGATNDGARAEKQVKERCQKGIPPSLRGRAWLYLTGGKVKREQNAGRYQVSRRTAP